MGRREFYSTVDLGGRALLVRSRIGGGFSKVADCRTVSGAQRLVEELNGVRCVHVDDIREAIRLLGLGTAKGAAQAAELLRLAAGPEPEEDDNAPDA